MCMCVKRGNGPVTRQGPVGWGGREWGEGATVDRKRRRLEAEAVALDDRGYVRLDRLYRFPPVP